MKLTSIGILPPPHIGSHTVSPHIILHILQATREQTYRTELSCHQFQSVHIFAPDQW